ncbi:MAG: MmgE/PrpD family protein [Dehalococcoidia bacterium]
MLEVAVVGITETLARFIVETCYEHLPAKAIEQARRASLDTLGVMLAGSLEDCSRIAARMVREDGCNPVATVVGQGFRGSAAGAALVNGIAGHALDYDDVNTSMRGHPSIPLLPAVLAAAEETDAGGKAVIAAYVVGFEVQARIGRGLGPSHYPHGWHATSTLGSLGAAAAAAQLYGLDVEQTRMALGIAASLAGGSRQNFGSMTKPLHPGHAAQSGLVAARLARSGFTADPEIVEAPLGFLNLFSPAGDAQPERVLEGIASPFDIVEPGISVKKYPCCFGTHRALDAVLALSAEQTIEAADVKRVEVVVSRGSAAPLIHPRPRNGLEGKFSMQYCIAAALLDGGVRLDSFLDDAVRRPQAQELLKRVILTEDGAGSGPAEGYADVTVLLSNGLRLNRRVDEPRGGPSQPLSWQELVAKFRDCAERVIGIRATEQAIEQIAALDKLPAIGALTESLAGATAAASAGI